MPRKKKNEIPEHIIREISNTITVLKKGGIILYPTDTIWGLGCDATNEKAVEKIYKIKQREDSKSMLALVSDIDMLDQYVQAIPKAADQILEVAEKPTTIIYPDAIGFAQNLIAHDKSIGIRIVNTLFCNQLIKQFKVPIVSTSANISGEKSPAFFREITSEIKSKVDYIVNIDQNSQKKSTASSIIKVERNNVIKIIRK